MKKLFNKIKEYFSHNDAKASLWATILTIILFIPFILIFVTLLMQYSYITKQFWLFIYLAILVFILLFSFTAVMYRKLLANYEQEKIDKKEYARIYLKELLSPFCICFLIVATIIFMDQLSKNLANRYLVEGVSNKVIPYLINFRLAYNTGAAWSILSDHTNILAYVSLIASFVILFFLRKFDLKKRPLYSLALAFILGGTVGNMIDRFFYPKGVIDFIDFAFMDFPTFNIADSFLVVGTILLALYLIIDIVKDEKNKKIQKESNQNKTDQDETKQNVVESEEKIND